MYSTASQRDQGHITVARVAGKHRHVPGDGCRCRWPSVRNQPSLAGGRNPRRLARRPPQPCAPRVHTDSGGGVAPTGQDSRLGHHTRDLPLTREVSLLLPAPYHPITWTIPRKHTPHRNRTRQDPLVHIHREAPAEESDVTAALSSHQDSVQATGSGAAHLARHSITGSFHRNDTKEDTVTSPSSSSPQILAREGEAESNLNGSHITRRSVLLVYTFCSQGWWTPPLQLGCAPTAPHHGRQELDYVVCMYLQRIEWVGLGHHRTTTGC